MSFTPLIQMLFAPCVSGATRSSENTSPFLLSADPDLTAQFALLLLWSHKFPVPCEPGFGPSDVCLFLHLNASPHLVLPGSNLSVQGQQSCRMGSALGPTPHICSRNHASVGKELFPEQEKGHTQREKRQDRHKAVHLSKHLRPSAARRSNG